MGKAGRPVRSGGLRLFATQAAIEPATSDGLTVEGIVSNQWTILDESESDWKSHAAAIAQSISLIKKRLQVERFLCDFDFIIEMQISDRSGLLKRLSF